MTGPSAPTSRPGVRPTMVAIILAGGSARRLGGVDKPAVPVGGVPMIVRVLAAVEDADPRIVVGPPGLPVPPDVRMVREQPPGGGPVAGIAAALTAMAVLATSVPEGVITPGTASDGIGSRSVASEPSQVASEPSYVALLAGDLPLLSPVAIDVLRAAAHTGSGSPVDGAVFVDDTGRRQWLCGVWHLPTLRARVAALVESRGTADGASLRDLLGPLRVAEVASGAGTHVVDRGRASNPLPPWFDCDTDDDIRRAEEWLTR